MNSNWEKRRKRLFEIIEIGSNYDAVCWGYDFFNTFTIILNLAVSIMYTFDTMELKYGPILLLIERLTVGFFALDFILRLYTAKYLYPDVSEPRAVSKYIFSFSGIVDILSFVPYYMPFFFPAGAVAFRMLRIVRIFRLFRINAYYDSLNVITEVIICIYYPDPDAFFQSLHVQPGKPGTAGSFYQCFFRYLVGSLHFADCRLR